MRRRRRWRGVAGNCKRPFPQTVRRQQQIYTRMKLSGLKDFFLFWLHLDRRPELSGLFLVLVFYSLRNLMQTKSAFSPPSLFPPEPELLAAALWRLWRCSSRVNGIMQMAALLKRPFEVFNGDYGNGWTAQTFFCSMKRRHNDKKGADLQLQRGSARGSRGERSACWLTAQCLALKHFSRRIHPIKNKRKRKKTCIFWASELVFLDSRAQSLLTWC